jgi:hypothetical protein
MPLSPLHLTPQFLKFPSASQKSRSAQLTSAGPAGQARPTTPTPPPTSAYRVTSAFGETFESVSLGSRGGKVADELYENFSGGGGERCGELLHCKNTVKQWVIVRKLLN